MEYTEEIALLSDEIAKINVSIVNEVSTVTNEIEVTDESKDNENAAEPIVIPDDNIDLGSDEDDNQILAKFLREGSMVPASINIASAADKYADMLLSRTAVSNKYEYSPGRENLIARSYDNYNLGRGHSYANYSDINNYSKRGEYVDYDSGTEYGSGSDISVLRHPYSVRAPRRYPAGEYYSYDDQRDDAINECLDLLKEQATMLKSLISEVRSLRVQNNDMYLTIADLAGRLMKMEKCSEARSQDQQ